MRGALLSIVGCLALLACGATDPAGPSSERGSSERGSAERASTERRSTEPTETGAEGAHPPTVDPAPEAEETSPAPPTPIPAGPCTADADCGFDSPCLPRLCVTNPPELDACDESGPPPGTCACVEGRCALRPNAERGEVTSNEDCEAYGERTCGLDLAAGACAPGGGAQRRGRTWTGPRCFCDGRPPRRCHFRWIEPVACGDVEDCWVEHDPLPHPIARPRRLRGRRFRPCADGELAPACVDGQCTLRAYGC